LNYQQFSSLKNANQHSDVRVKYKLTSLRFHNIVLNSSLPYSLRQLLFDSAHKTVNKNL